MKTQKFKSTEESEGRLTLQHPDAVPGSNGKIVTYVVVNIPDGVKTEKVKKLLERTTAYPAQHYFQFSELGEGKILKPNQIAVADAAKSLGISDRRVRALIDSGNLPAYKIGRDWLISEPDLELVRDRKPGRPVKSED